MIDKLKGSMEVITHFYMCIIGGFLGVYTLLLRGNFGSAQTANLIQLFINLGKGNIHEVLLRISAFIIYVGILAAAVILRKRYGHHAKKICIIVQLIGVALIGFIPESADNLLALLPVFAITALQWGNFNGTKEYSSPTLFSTGNIRQCTQSWTEYALNKDKKIKLKALFYSGTLFFYHCGVALGILFINLFHAQSIWICLLPLSAVFLMLIFCENENSNIGLINIKKLNNKNQIQA